MPMTPNAATGCHPLTLSRSIADFPIGNIPLAEHHLRLCAPEEILLMGNAWIDAEDFSMFLTSGRHALAAACGEIIARNSRADESAAPLSAQHSFVIRHPWDLLSANERFMDSLDGDRIEGDIHSSAVVEGILHVGSGTRILPGVFIEGNVVIGSNCKIGPNCYIRGNTSIGNSCHIGQSVEIKNCLILSGSNVGHISYVGDSILGEKVNFGAGTMVSNLRHDGGNHKSMVDGQLVDTGRRKFGCVAGDGVRTGIHTSIYCGRKLWPYTSTRPGEIVQRDILS